MGFRFIPTPIADLYLIEPTLYGDPRGYFLETYHRRAFADVGITVDFVQDNEARSRRGIRTSRTYRTTRSSKRSSCSAARHPNKF